MLAVLLTGCERARVAPELSATYQAARQASERNDHPAAAVAYRQLLDQYPSFARGHLELAMLYDEKLGDPIEAIHHYRRYLALESSSDRRRVVEDFTERSKLALVGKAPTTGADAGELVRLQDQNNALLAEIATLKATAVPTPVTNVVVTPVPATNPVVVVTEPARPRTHIVQKGDTLFSLAVRYYGTPTAWDKIYQANKSSLPNKDQLRIGQSLVIP
jgi:nucleoid-associated protein YgaU